MRTLFVGLVYTVAWPFCLFFSHHGTLLECVDSPTVCVDTRQKGRLVCRTNAGHTLGKIVNHFRRARGLTGSVRRARCWRCYALACQPSRMLTSSAVAEKPRVTRSSHWKFFTALHGMQTRSSPSDENNLSVHTVRLSNAWIASKQKKDLSTFLYHTKDHLS